MEYNRDTFDIAVNQFNENLLSHFKEEYEEAQRHETSEKIISNSNITMDYPKKYLKEFNDGTFVIRDLIWEVDDTLYIGITDTRIGEDWLVYDFDFINKTSSSCYWWPTDYDEEGNPTHYTNDHSESLYSIVNRGVRTKEIMNFSETMSSIVLGLFYLFAEQAGYDDVEIDDFMNLSS